MRVLVACEFSGMVRDAFAARGHDAWSCDIIETEKPGKHICADVLTVLDQGWDLIIAHPPCTYLANSGVRWLYKNGEVDQDRFAEIKKASEFFRQIALAPVDKICIENPIQHKHAKKLIRVNAEQTIQPWMFGHGETKATQLWLKELPPLKPTDVVNGRTARVHRASPGKNRWKERSRTMPGIAKAMAEQWG